jgi:type IV pilus assembly protein PilA
MRSFKRSLVRGFTLVELMIVVAIIGVLAALAIYGVTRYLASAKTSEAKNTLGSINRDAQQAFSKEQNASEIVLDNTQGTQFSQDLCGTSNYSITTGIPSGKKAQPTAATFKLTGPGNSVKDGWLCLNFEMSDPTYYRYGYTANRIVTSATAGTIAPPAKLIAALGMPTNGFYAFAEGDLDGDTVNSALGLAGEVNPATRVLKTATQVTVVDEGE